MGLFIEKIGVRTCLHGNKDKPFPLYAVYQQPIREDMAFAVILHLASERMIPMLWQKWLFGEQRVENFF